MRRSSPRYLLIGCIRPRLDAGLRGPGRFQWRDNSARVHTESLPFTRLRSGPASHLLRLHKLSTSEQKPLHLLNIREHPNCCHPRLPSSKQNVALGMWSGIFRSFAPSRLCQRKAKSHLWRRRRAAQKIYSRQSRVFCERYISSTVARSSDAASI